MFALNTFIDNVQAAKRYFVATYITDNDVRETWYSYIDTQTAFVKQAVKTNEVMTRKLDKLKIW